MRRAIFLLAVLALVLLTFHSSPVVQAQTASADQSTACAATPSGSVAVSGATWKGQSFVPAVTGTLTRVQIPGTHAGGTTTLHIRPLLAGKPAQPYLASANYTGSDMFDFGSGIVLRAGQRYALVLSNQGGSYSWRYSNGALCYPKGDPFTSTSSGQLNTWSQDVADFYFTTYMTPSAAPPPDQWTTCVTEPGGQANVTGTTWKAQTFVAGMTGQLTRVELPGSRNALRTATLRIRETDANGIPTSDVAGSAPSSITAGNAFVFSTPAQVIAGKTYALVLQSTGTDGRFEWSYSRSTTCYSEPRGTSFTSTNSGAGWTQDQVDFYFITYVNPDTVPITTPPTLQLAQKDQTTVLGPAGTVAVSGSTWKAQTFMPVGSGTVTLRRVELPGYHASGTTTLHIRATDPTTGKPTGGDLSNGTSSITGGNIFSFNAGVSLAAGTLYALVLENSTGSYVWSYSNSATCYPNTRGAPYTGTSGGSWNPDSVDFYFITYNGSASTPTLDQTCTTSIIGGVTVTGSTLKAQTFKPSGSGTVTLLRVELAGVNNGGTTTLHIRATDSSGRPTGSDLSNGTSQISGGNVFTFGAGVSLTAGQTYALVLENSGGSYTWEYSGCEACYQNGKPHTKVGTGSWTTDIVDFYFTAYMRPVAGSPQVALPPIWRGPALTKPTVFVISFATGAQQTDPQALTEQFVALLSEASRYHGYGNVNSAVKPYLEFKIYGNTVRKYPGLPAKTGGNYNYGAVFDYYGLCSLIQNRQVDEVWFWDAGQGGFAEWVTKGPDWESAGGFNARDCGREVTTMTFNYNRALDVALESYNHRLEGLAMHYFPCAFWTTTWPWTGAPSWCSGLTSDQNGFVGRPFSGNSQVGVCGDAHHPPNILDSHEYDYTSTTTVSSSCKDWRLDGTATVRTFNCNEWGCNKDLFHIWWMQNLPGVNNTNVDWSSKRQPNWWAYLVDRTPHTLTN